jgi:hypothetical protein
MGSIDSPRKREDAAFAAARLRLANPLRQQANISICIGYRT